MFISLPEEVTYILYKLHEHGFAGYIVGGCVRDSLLNTEPDDWDITTDARPDQVKQLFAKTIDTGLKHGTVTVVINGRQYEVTTFRHLGSVTNADSLTLLKEDLSRRDFTINAMAYSRQTGLVDYFNGVNDLKKGVINAVGKPEQRFREDALRMIRAIRLACQLNFIIGSETFAAITGNHQLLRSVSRERIRDELGKIVLTDQPGRGILMLRSTSLLGYILPELADSSDFEHTLAILEAAPKKLTVRLAALLYKLGQPWSEKENEKRNLSKPASERQDSVRRALNRLKFSKQTVDTVYRLVREQLDELAFPDKVSIKKFITRVGPENLQSFFELQAAVIKASQPSYDFSALDVLQEQVCNILKEKQPLTVKDLAVNGYDLMEIGIQPGEQMGQVLDRLLEKVLAEPEMNTKENLLKMVMAEQGIDNV